MASPSPLGIVLAGGAGSRLGGAKARAKLCGRPLISYPVAALQAALGDVVVVAKPDTALPALPGQEVWFEDDPHRHPLVGIRTALQRAGGRAVVVCALDLPLVTPALIRRLAFTETEPAAVLACHRGAVQPLLGCYRQAAVEPLAAAAPDVSLREAVATLAPKLVEVDDELQLLNVNTSADLRRAAEVLRAAG